MNYPTEYQTLQEMAEAKKWEKRKRCFASENGGCYCTGECERNHIVGDLMDEDSLDHIEEMI